MRLRSLLSSLALLPSLLCVGQGTKTNPLLINWPLITGAGAPTSACTSLNYGQPYLNTTPTPNAYYVCGADGWQIRGASTSFPSTPGFVFNTSPSASRNGLASDMTTLLGFQPAATAAIETTGLLVDLQYNETAGTTVVDQSGHGNSSTISNSSGLVRDGIGYYFSNTTPLVTHATGVNPTNSHYWLINFPIAIAGVTQLNQGYWFNTTATPTLNSGIKIDDLGCPTGGPPFCQYSLGVYGFGVRDSLQQNYMVPTNYTAGPHVFTLVCTASVAPTLYLDGHAMPPAIAGKSCNNAQTSGNFTIGGMVFTIYRELHYSNVHTQDDVTKNVTSILANAVQKGVPFVPVSYQAPGAALIFAGDSITCGTELTPDCPNSNGQPGGSSAAYPALIQAGALTDNTYLSLNYGVPSEYVQGQILSAPYTYAQVCHTQGAQSIAFNFEGTNNPQSYDGITAAQVFGLHAAWSDAMFQYGCQRRVLVTPIARGGTTHDGINYDTWLQGLAAADRNGYKNVGFNGIVDLNGDPVLGCTGCETNATYFFQTVQIHPNGTGQAVIASAVACTVNWLDGSSPANMNQAQVTTTSGTLACRDGGVNFNPVGGNIARTMNSARWQTGRQVRYCNVAPSGANTVTLTAPGDFNFNNRSGATTVVIAANTCVNFEATFNGNVAAPGNFWKTM